MVRLGIGLGINAGGAPLSSSPYVPGGTLSVAEYCIGLTESSVKFAYTATEEAILVASLKDPSATPKERLAVFGITLSAGTGTYDWVFQNSALVSPSVIEEITKIDGFIAPSANPGWANRWDTISYGEGLATNLSCTSLVVSQFNLTTVPSGYGSGAIGLYIKNASGTIYEKDGTHYLYRVTNASGFTWNLKHTTNSGDDIFTTVNGPDPTINVNPIFSVDSVYYA